MDDDAVDAIPSGATANPRDTSQTTRRGVLRRRLGLGVIAALGISLSALPVATPVSSAPISMSSFGCAGKAYWPIGASAQIAVVELRTAEIETRIPLPVGVNTPERIAVSPNGEFVLTASGSTAYLITTATATISAAIQVGSGAQGVAFHPTERLAYVANNASGTVSVIDVNTASVIETIGSIPGASAVAITGDGSRLLVTSHRGWGNPGDVMIVNTSTNLVTRTLEVGIAPVSMAMSRDGGFAYVVNAGANTVSKLALIGVPNVSATWTLPSFGWGAGLNPDASILYVGSQMGGGEETYFRLDTATGTTTTVAAGFETQFMAVTDDGSQVYASGSQNPGGQTLGKFNSSDDSLATVVPNENGSPNEIALCSTTPPIGVPGFTMSTSTVSVALGTALSNPYTISMNSWAVPVFSVSPELPMGIIFNAATGALTGTPLFVQPATTYTILANSGGNARSAEFELTITAAAPPQNTPPSSPPSGSVENNFPLDEPTASAPSITDPSQPALVTADNQVALTQNPGGATAMVNGIEVPIELTSVADSEAGQTAPELRTPEQIAEIQQVAAAVVARLDALAGGDSSLTVVTTDTGANVAGVFPDMVVPIEDVIVLDLTESAALFAARSDEGEIVKVQPGAILEVTPDGEVAVLAYGLPVGDDVELVIMSTPTLLGRFTVGQTGSVETIAYLPEGIQAGNHTLVVASERVQAALGLKVSGRSTFATERTALLPSTGVDLRLDLIVLVMSFGSLLVLIGTRRRWSDR
jgi:YVTN family beta-propeller protein